MTKKDGEFQKLQESNMAERERESEQQANKHCAQLPKGLNYALRSICNKTMCLRGGCCSVSRAFT